MILKIYKWRKMIAVPVLAVMIAFAPVRTEASAGAIFGLTAAMLGACLVVGGACKYYRGSGAPINRVASNGTITAALIAGWYSVNKFMQSLWMGKNVTAKIERTDVLAATTAHPGKYPLMEEALKGRYPEYNADTTVGNDVYIPGVGNVHVTNVSWPFAITCRMGSYSTVTTATYIQFQVNGSGGNCAPGASSWGVKKLVFQGIAAPPGSPESFAANLANTAQALAAQDIYSDRYGNEIDDFIKDNPNVIDFVDTADPDDTAAPPFVPPADAGVNPGAGTTTIDGLGAEEAARAAQAAEAARGQYEAAKQAAQAARDAAAADPTNEELKRLVEIAEAAQLAAEKALEAAEKLALEKAQEAEEAYPDPGGGDFKKLNWSKWRDLFGVLQTVWPFSLLVGLSAKYGAFVGDGSAAPVFHIPMPLGNDLVIDMAPFNSIAQMSRYTIAVMLIIGVTWAIVRFYRGVS